MIDLLTNMPILFCLAILLFITSGGVLVGISELVIQNI